VPDDATNQPPADEQDMPRLGPRLEENGRLLTARQVADLFAVPESWVREATRDGRLPHLRLGRYRRYQRRTIEAWLLNQQAGPAVSPAKRPDLPTPRRTSL
jgi:excisionase family DNA binding protein